MRLEDADRWDNRVPPAPLAALLAGAEGLRLEPYDDNGSRPGGTWTIGWGSTRDADGQPVGPRTPPITREQADALLARDVGEAIREVRGSVTRPLSQHEAAALVSLAYNLGSLQRKARTLLRLVNGYDRPGAARQFREYVLQEGRPVLGLRRRRWMEAAVFLGADPEEARRSAWERIQSAHDWPPLPSSPRQEQRREVTADDLNAAELARIRGEKERGDERV